MTAAEHVLGCWVAEDATKSLEIRAGEGGALRVTVWEGLGGAPLAEDRPATLHPPEPGREADGYARARLGYLQVELGDPGLGSTYDLMVGYPSDDPSATGGFAWGRLPSGGDPSRLRLFPEMGASFYEAVLGAWDDFVEEARQAEGHWIEPLSSYRPATADERARLRGAGAGRAG